LAVGIANYYMDKQTIIIIIVALIVAIWGGWQTYVTYPDVIKSLDTFSETAEQIGIFKTIVFLLVKIIPIFFIIGGIGMLCLQKWSLGLVHSALVFDLCLNFFRIGRHIYYWFTKMQTIEITAQEYFFDRYILMVLVVFIVEIVITNLTTRLRNELID
jgi:hypothetical protein